MSFLRFHLKQTIIIQINAHNKLCARRRGKLGNLGVKSINRETLVLCIAQQVLKSWEEGGFRTERWTLQVQGQDGCCGFVLDELEKTGNHSSHFIEEEESWAKRAFHLFRTAFINVGAEKVPLGKALLHFFQFFHNSVMYNQWNHYEEKKIF